MSINTAYDYQANSQGEAHFYYAQYKNNRMREWYYACDSGSLEDVIQHIKEAKERAEQQIQKGDKYYISRYKTMKWRIIKADMELLPEV
jgi:hypothetical protein